jgi:hypothetical protein
MRIVRIGWILAAFLVFAAVPIFAQQGTADISGKITDDSGAVLPGVSVVATNEATGVFREATSSPEGTFFIPQLAPGRYKVVAKLTGFRTVERNALVL